MSIVMERKKNDTQSDTLTYKRGDIWYADLNLSVGSEQGGMRPVLIIQNDIGNKHSPTVIVATITSSEDKKNKKLPTHVFLNALEHNLDRDSVVTLEQIKTVDKLRLIEKLSKLDPWTMKEVDKALQISTGTFY